MNRVLLFLFFAFGLTLDAAATSCTPFEHRYFVLCDATGCRGAFGVMEVPSFGTCSRRPVVDDLDRRVGDFLSKVVLDARAPEAHGLYLIKLSARWWNADNPGTFEGVTEILGQLLHRDGSEWKVTFSAMSISEIVAQLNERQSREWLKQVGTDPSLEAVEVERSTFEALAIKAQVKNIILAVAYWLSSLIALLVFVHSVHVYFSRLYDLRYPKRRFALILPLAIQIAIGGIGGVVTFLYPFEFWFGALLIPAAVVILLAEGWARFQRKNCPLLAVDHSDAQT